MQTEQDKLSTAKMKEEVLKEDSEIQAPKPSGEFEWEDERLRKAEGASDLNISNTCSKEKLNLFNCLEKHPKKINECQKFMNQMDLC